jgi:type VI secretion system secreted protein VgrG
MVPFEVSISSLDDASLRVLSFSGQERLSEPFEYSVELVSEDAGLALEDLVGQTLTLEIHALDGTPQRWVHGVIASFQQADSSLRRTMYQAVVVPPLQLLSYRQDCRIFQDTSVPDIIKTVFDQAGVDGYKIELKEKHEPRVYCVQYRESDLNFVTRLMEDEGIFYYFDHTEEKTTLTLIDKANAHPALPDGDTLDYQDTGGGVAANEFVFGISWEESITTSAIVLRDFDFRKPSVDHMHLDKEVDQCIKLEHYDYPGLYEKPEIGDQRVCNRLDALQASRHKVSASTTARRLLPGFRFTLAEHPNSRFNCEYVITSVSHSGSSPQVLEEEQGGATPGYSCQFLAVPSGTILRPELMARRPRVDGIQTAIVVGPSGEEIYTDEFGRVKVQFHWDRIGEYNEKSSCWVRVSQLWAGAGWGGMEIPRIGHEVIVSFEEGDPDRPLITGRVYHGENRPPHVLPDNKVKSTIRSNSTPGGGGFNELTFDDTKDKEEVFLKSQRNTTISTGSDKNQTTGNNESLSVGKNRTKTVDGDETTNIGKNRTEEVGADEKITIGGEQKVDVGSDRKTTVAANEDLKVGANSKSEIGGNNTIKITSNDKLDVGVNQKTTVGAAADLSVGTTYKINAGASVEVTAAAKITLSAGGSKVEISPAGVTIQTAALVTVMGSIIKLN